MVHFVAQPAPWHWAHETAVLPPWRSAPWQVWQLARPRFALTAWKPVLAWSIQAVPAWTLVASTLPSRCVPEGSRKSSPSALTEVGWQMLQSAALAPTAGCGAGGGTPWQVPPDRESTRPDS